MIENTFVARSEHEEKTTEFLGADWSELVDAWLEAEISPEDVVEARPVLDEIVGTRVVSWVLSMVEPTKHEVFMGKLLLSPLDPDLNNYLIKDKAAILAELPTKVQEFLAEAKIFIQSPS